MTFLTTTAPSIRYTIQLFVTLVRTKPKSADSLSVIIGVICNENNVLYAEFRKPFRSDHSVSD